MSPDLYYCYASSDSHFVDVSVNLEDSFASPTHGLSASYDTGSCLSLTRSAFNAELDPMETGSWG